MFFKRFAKNLIYFVFNIFSFLKRPSGAAILMYHSVSHQGGFFTVKPEDFIWQMSYLRRKKYQVVSLSAIVGLLEARRPIPSKTVALTFDDGYQDNYSIVWPILKKYNFPATIFLAIGFIGGQREIKSQGIIFKMMNWQQIAEMKISGLIDFQPHTVSHPKLAEMNFLESEKEILTSKKEVEAKLNQLSQIFSYPDGNYNQEVINILKRNNFKAAVTVVEGLVKNSDDLFQLKRCSIDSTTNKIQFVGKVRGSVEWYEKIKNENE